MVAPTLPFSFGHFYCKFLDPSHQFEFQVLDGPHYPMTHLAFEMQLAKELTSKWIGQVKGFPTFCPNI